MFRVIVNETLYGGELLKQYGIHIQDINFLGQNGRRFVIDGEYC